MSYAGPGRYRHYKGGEYEVVGLAFNERSKESDFSPTDPLHQEVVYRPLTPGSLLDDTEVTFWLRQRRDFDAMVDRVEGAMRSAAGMALGRVDFQAACNALGKAIGDPDGEYLPRWNDDRKRTFYEVIAALDRAILATTPSEAQAEMPEELVVS